MKKPFDPALEKAVMEYYDYQGDRNVHLVRFVENKASARNRTRESGQKCSGYTMLLVRFIDERKNKMSALMAHQRWADGHWDVTEFFFVPRECEKILVRNFEKSEEYV